MERELLKAGEVGDRLGVSEAAVRKWAVEGLPALRIGRLRRYKLEEVIGWLQEREAEWLNQKQVMTKTENGTDATLS